MDLSNVSFREQRVFQELCQWSVLFVVTKPRWTCVKKDNTVKHTPAGIHSKHFESFTEECLKKKPTLCPDRSQTCEVNQDGVLQ